MSEVAAPAPAAPGVPEDTATIARRLAERVGRPVRILHVGNIANNAYLNARLLNDAGFDCDVLCYDYYHIMGCPEWEDAAIVGTIADHFAPDWDSVDLGGFVRPDWFVQDGFEAASLRLIERRSGTPSSLRTAPDAGSPRRTLRTRIVGRLRREILARAPHALLAARSLPRRGARVLCALAIALRDAVSVVCTVTGAKRLVPKPLRRAWRRTAARLDAWKQRLDQPPAIPVELAGAAAVRELQALFSARFCGRADTIQAGDIVPYLGVLPRWHELMAQYDVVVGYATDGLYPLLCGKHPYFAFEHGTIRSIPFEATGQGRLCALTYREADHAFITNCDNITAAERLGLERFGFLPHPVNEAFLDESDAHELRAELCAELDADFLVFHPARQHWEPDDRKPNWEKGNDHLIRGFAAFVHQTGARAGAIFVDWGQTVDASKALLAELGVADRVKWIDPLPNRAMIRCVLASDLVADQFHLGAFGSLTPKALMCGRPCMLYLDEERHRWCFPELPPVINAGAPEQVAAGLVRLHGDPAWREELARAGRTWYRRYHSNEVIGRTFATAVERALRDRGLLDGQDGGLA